MSEIAEAVTVALVLADFAATDSAGKGNIIGGGVAVLGVNPNQGTTARFALWASIHLPTAMCPAEFPVEFSLHDAAGALVQVPGPTGEFQPLRVAQIVQMDKPTVPVPNAIREHIGARVQVVFEFGNGLPLPSGGLYEWRLRVDGDDEHIWRYPLAVAAPLPGPTFG